VVFAHGTGGSFRSHVRAEVAGALANATTPSGAVQFAVLGIDQVEHGPRRGSSTDSPNNLFFNFANPQAARGNPLQGAADQISLARFASALDVAASETGGDAIKIDPNEIVFFGHSQGATHGSLALPYADTYRAAVLSGNGASLMDALVTKTSPVNVAAAVVWVLGDPDANSQLSGGVMHPALTLLQQWIDPADPLNFASSAGGVPQAGHTAKHLFQTYGLGDTFSPPVTLETYALAGGLALATADVSVGTPDPIGNLAPQPLPLAGNVSVSGNPVTLAVREYAPPSGKDGHFVVFDVASANADAVRFLAMAAAGQVPAVGP
jgi:predicted esterase